MRWVFRAIAIIILTLALQTLELRAPSPAACPTCVILGPAVLHPSCIIMVVAEGRTCS